MKETVIQFGTGNFLRGFVDYFIHKMNAEGVYSGKAVVVQPTIGGKAALLNSQGCVYNLFLRGIENGKEICEHTEIHSISRAVDPYSDFADYIALAKNPDFRFIVSNTTEAGIEFDKNCLLSDKPALSFPGKLTQLLFERYKSGLAGFVILPCELIDNNGDELKKCVLKYAALWNLGEGFTQWLEAENHFCNTLVDRIVTGYPKDEAKILQQQIGCDDKLLDAGELFHLWVIEGDFENELPLNKAGFNVIWTDDVKPYKKMKVRVLNGAHTSIVFPALLAGIATVNECLQDELISELLNTNLYKCILPVLGETDETRAFTASVTQRFKNPHIQHQLKSIALNSVSKFTVRVLPTMLEYKQIHGEAPKTLALSLASLIVYYKQNDVSDNQSAVDFIKVNSVDNILKNDKLWGWDLTEFSSITETAYKKITTDGISGAIKWALF